MQLDTVRLGGVLIWRTVTQALGRDGAQGAVSAAWLFHASERQHRAIRYTPGPVLALRVIAKFAHARLANGTIIGFSSRLVSGEFGNDPPAE